MSWFTVCRSVPPPSVTLSPPPTGVFAGQDVVLTCTIVLDPSADGVVTVPVEWFDPTSNMIASNTATMSSSLTYTSTTTLTGFMAGDVGGYRCAAVVASARSLITPSESVSSSADIALSESITHTHRTCNCLRHPHPLYIHTQLLPPQLRSLL